MTSEETVLLRSVASMAEAEALLAGLWIIAVRNGLDPPRIQGVNVGREVELSLLFRDFGRWTECAGDRLDFLPSQPVRGNAL